MIPQDSVRYHHDMIQYTEEWWKERLGMLTASNMKLLITPKGAISKAKTVTQFASELAAQRETQNLEEGFISWDMERGKIEEGFARKVYSKNISPVVECGFITREFDNFIVGMSPDGLVGSDGGIEIKSRKQKFQVETIVSGDMPDEYGMQVQTSLWITGRDWWDFIQYSNGMPLFVRRILPDLEIHELFFQAVTEFEEQVSMIQDSYREKIKTLVPCERIDLNEQDALIEESRGNRDV